MPSKTDNISKLYNSLKNAGYQDIGTEQEFRDYCGDEKNVKTLHEALTNEGYDDVGTESEFESWLHPDNASQELRGNHRHLLHLSRASRNRDTSLIFGRAQNGEPEYSLAWMMTRLNKRRQREAPLQSRGLQNQAHRA